MLTCTAIAYPMPNMAFWERSSDGDRVQLEEEEMFTATDTDVTVTIKVVVPCVPEGYRCLVENEQERQQRDITICNEGGHTLYSAHHSCEIISY